MYPVSRTLTRFNDPHHANRLTSACGPEIYRDTLLGDEFYGDAFVCEPVHNLVRRARLEPSGISFRSRRAPGEERSEFLASTDNWFRPVEVRTGPDGALWVVDFYRFVIEHPRWISPERLRDLDVRAGADRGRIWRVVPQGRAVRPIRDLTRLNADELAGVLASPNGVERDLAHRLLIEPGQNDPVLPMALGRIVRSGPNPASRVQALAVFSGRGDLAGPVLHASLKDPDPRVRQNALRRMEGRSDASGML